MHSRGKTHHRNISKWTGILINYEKHSQNLVFHLEVFIIPSSPTARQSGPFYGRFQMGAGPLSVMPYVCVRLMRTLYETGYLFNLNPNGRSGLIKTEHETTAAAGAAGGRGKWDKSDDSR